MYPRINIFCIWFLHSMTEFHDQGSFNLAFIPCFTSANFCGSFSHSEEINTKFHNTGAKATNTDRAT